jgi:hypothetical protein
VEERKRYVRVQGVCAFSRKRRESARRRERKGKRFSSTDDDDAHPLLS